jgi:hypothetical protein
MARGGFLRVALLLVGALCAPAAELAAVTLRGEVIARERADGSQSLGVAVSQETVAQLPPVRFDELLLKLSKRQARGLRAGHLPEGWRFDAEETRLWGPPIERGAFRLDAPSDWIAPTRIDLDCRSGGRSLYGARLDVQQRDKAWESGDLTDYLDLPGTLRVGVPIRLDASTRNKLGYEVDWRITNPDPLLDLGLRFGYGERGERWLEGRVPDPYMAWGWNPHLEPLWPWERSYVVEAWDPFGERVLRDEWRPSFLPFDYRMAPQPRFDAVTEIVAPNSVLCVCGYVPELALWNQFRVGPRPLGAPIVATSGSAIFLVPSGLPIGPLPVDYMPWLTAGRATGLETEHIEVRGSVAMDVIQRGGSTPLTLEILGSDRIFPVRLINWTPGIIDLEGGALQIRNTSGGTPNRIVRQVTGLSRGNFIVNYLVALPSCPCDDEGRSVADRVAAEYRELLETAARMQREEVATSTIRLRPGETVTLRDGRFRVEISFTPRAPATGRDLGTTWQPPEQAAVDRAQPTSWTPATDGRGLDVARNAAGDSAFYSIAPGDLEAMVKVVDACATNGNYWVLAGGLTDVGYALAVTDTRSGAKRSYSHPRGHPAQAVQDTAAFATCP